MKRVVGEQKVMSIYGSGLGTNMPLTVETDEKRI